jgi:hypothetical protein
MLAVSTGASTLGHPWPASNEVVIVIEKSTAQIDYEHDYDYAHDFGSRVRGVRGTPYLSIATGNVCAKTKKKNLTLRRGDAERS